MPKHNILVVKMWGFLHCDVKLGGVRVWALVRHAELILLRVFMVEVLIGEVLAVDGLASCAIIVDYVPCLDYETCDYSVETVGFVVERLPTFPHTLFSCTETAKVLHRLRALRI
jgi:hypothetical protein